MNPYLRFVLPLVLVAVVIPSTRAGDETPALYGINEKIEGKTYSEWAVAFSQWALTAKKDRNPILDQTGKFAGEGQKEKVWFLAGNFGGVTERTFEVPAGKPIFSPVVYTFPHDPGDKVDAKQLAKDAKESMDEVGGLEVTVNGKSLGDLSKHRASAGPFTLNFPTGDDALNSFMVGKQSVVLDGYWFALKPLPPGDHVIKVKGRRLKGGFELNITYELKVVKGK